MALVLDDIDPDRQYTVDEKAKYKTALPAYDAFGGNMDYKTKVKGYPDLYATIQNMSKQTAWLWWEMVKLRDRKTNISIYKPKDKVAVNRLTKAYKDLKALNLVKRAKRQRYIINPAAYIPTFNEYDEVVKAWEAI